MNVSFSCGNDQENDIAICSLSAATGILFVVVLILSALLVVAFTKLRKGTRRKYQPVEESVHVHVTGKSAFGNPTYEPTRATTSQADAIPPTADHDRVRSDSMYMTIPAENGHVTTSATQPSQCSAAADTSTKPMEVPTKCLMVQQREAAVGAGSSSVGYTRILDAQCKLIMLKGAGGGKESGDLQRSDAFPSVGKEPSATEHATEAAGVTLDAEAANQKVPTRQADGTSGKATEPCSQQQTVQPPAGANDTADEDENYATISDTVGPGDDDEEEDPYCLVGPSSENHSICSDVGGKELQDHVSSPDHFHSMYVLLGTSSMDNLHQKSQLEIQRMRKGISAGNGMELEGSFTLLTDNPCHDKDMDRPSLQGAAGCHLDPSPVVAGATAGQCRPNLSALAMPPQSIAVTSDDDQRTAAACLLPHAHGLPLITVHASTPQQDVGVAMMVGDSTPGRDRGSDTVCPNSSVGADGKPLQ